MAKQIVLFGGTFDPVHFGHLIVARAAGEHLGVAAITLVPTAQPPHKQQARAPASDRLAMLELAIEGDPLFDICRLELDRQGPSYTFDTLTALMKQYGLDSQLYWVVGADMLEGLHTWHRADEVLKLARLIVAARPPWDRDLQQLLGKLSGHLPADEIGKIAKSAVPSPLIDISSSDIRRRVRRGQPIKYLVPEPVRSYIIERGLYR